MKKLDPPPPPQLPDPNRHHTPTKTIKQQVPDLGSISIHYPQLFMLHQLRQCLACWAVDIH